MNKRHKLVIGLFGYGTVGEGLYHVLESSHTVDARIEKIVIKNPDKARNLPAAIFSTDSNAILQDSQINLVVELIDDHQAAYTIVKAALQAGKQVVSGNKKMLAHHLPELIALQEQTGSALLYDASACGSIPIIRNIEEYYDNDLLLSVTGILNGSSNYILSQLFQQGTDYARALQDAQEKGFAESDPSADVEGWDALYKLIIVTTHALGRYVPPEKVFSQGISTISPHDIQLAREKGYKIKLVAQLQKLREGEFTLFVLPKMVHPEEYIYNVEEEYNGVVIEGAFYDKQFMFGKGAGAFPTGSAVLSDITACSHHYRYEYKKMNYFHPPAYSTQCLLDVYLRYHDPEDLPIFDFEQITERYASQDFYYVRGLISLQQLLSIQPEIKKRQLFMAFYQVVV